MLTFDRRTIALLVVPVFALGAQGHITSPKEEFGHNFGDDYFLANYKQIETYWHKLAKESNRIVLHDMGKTPEGRTQWMAIVTSPENHKKLSRYKEISARLAHAEGLTDAQARALANEGKTVVWIDGGLHASEVLGAQQLGEMVYQMVSKTDEETMRFLNDVIVLFVHANPDGNDLVADWYMRNPVPEQRTMNGLPRLYQHYIGHENNRDFLASTQMETKNIDRALYHEWFPQILYNHHQSGPAGTVVYSPPLRDPYNYNLDPVLILGLQSLGAAMHTRLALEGKGGATMRSGGPYDGWWNGGLRNTATFHNTIAMLTEMIGSPTPTRIPLVLDRQIPTSDLAMPVPPQEWHFRQSIDYSITLDRATLDFASRLRENLLYDIYVMGKHSIERGSQDTWTANPRRETAIAAKLNPGAAAGRGGRGGAGTATSERDMALWAAIHAPELRDPRGYILPSDQVDFPTATKFVNTLLESGITVQRAARDFDAAGKHYPAGSYVVQTAQAFRPQIIDVFEAQVHPDVFPYPGALPTRPYDNAGWTMSYQMGVAYDRILDGFTGPFEKIGPWDVAPPVGKIASAGGAAGYVTDNRVVNSFIAATRLLKSNEEVLRLAAPLTVNGKTFGAGALYVRAKPSTAAALQRTLALGVNYEGTTSSPPADAVPLRTPRIGMWDVYGGNQDAGWMRWVLDTYEFSFDRVFAPALDAGNLDQKYDVLIFPQGGIPGAAGGGRGGGGGGGGAPTDAIPNLPAEYQGQVGRVTVEETLPRIRDFLEKGGTVIAIGTSAANLAEFLKLPIENQLAENGVPLPATKLFIPGSVLTARVNASVPAANGMMEHTDVFFDNSPVFKLGPDAAAKGVKTIAWFDTATPLHSGWAWGQNYLENGVIAVEAPVGKGKVLLYTPKIIERGQPHQTFKLLFNGIYYSVISGR